YPSPGAGSRSPGTRRTAACSTWPRTSTCRPGGRAAPVSATPARRDSSPDWSATRRSRSTLPPTVTYSSAVPNRSTTSPSTCSRATDQDVGMNGELMPVAHIDGIGAETAEQHEAKARPAPGPFRRPRLSCAFAFRRDDQVVTTANAEGRLPVAETGLDLRF